MARHLLTLLLMAVRFTQTFGLNFKDEVHGESDSQAVYPFSGFPHPPVNPYYAYLGFPYSYYGFPFAAHLPYESSRLTSYPYFKEQQLYEYPVPGNHPKDIPFHAKYPTLDAFRPPFAASDYERLQPAHTLTKSHIPAQFHAPKKSHIPTKSHTPIDSLGVVEPAKTYVPSKSFQPTGFQVDGKKSYEEVLPYDLNTSEIKTHIPAKSHIFEQLPVVEEYQPIEYLQPTKSHQPISKKSHEPILKKSHIPEKTVVKSHVLPPFEQTAHDVSPLAKSWSVQDEFPQKSAYLSNASKQGHILQLPVHTEGGDLNYVSEFDGTCLDKADGLYYVDERSFAFCTAGKRVIQACALGSLNPPLQYFSSGLYQRLQDFCSVNVATLLK